MERSPSEISDLFTLCSNLQNAHAWSSGYINPPKTTSWGPGTKASKHTEIAWPDAPLNTLSIPQPPKTTSWEPAGAKGRSNTKQ